MSFTRFSYKSFLLFPLFIITACGDREQNAIIPDRLVDERVVLSDPRNFTLQTNGGFIYINGGNKGIIIYRESSQRYRAFERTCTFDPDENKGCGKVMVDPSSLFMIDTCCNSQFDFMGNPFSGPATRNLIQYSTSINNNVLYIQN